MTKIYKGSSPLTVAFGSNSNIKVALTSTSLNEGFVYVDRLSTFDVVPGQTYTIGVQDASATNTSYSIDASATDGSVDSINQSSLSFTWTAPSNTNDGSTTAATLSITTSLGNAKTITANVRNTLPEDPAWGEYEHPGPSFSGITTWKSLTQLESDISSGTLDGLNTTGYRVTASDLAVASFDDSGIAVASATSISNAYITGCYFPGLEGGTWTKVAGTANTWEITLPDKLVESIITDPTDTTSSTGTIRFRITDPDAPRQPIVGVYPEASSERLAQHPLMYSYDWWRSYNKSDTDFQKWDVDISDDNGTSWVVENDNVNASAITNLRWASSSARADFESLYESGCFIIAHCGNNIMDDSIVKAYDSGTGTLDVSLSSFPGYVEFTLTGTKNVVKRPGQFAINVVEKKLYYWPEYIPTASGPTNVGVPYKSILFRCSVVAADYGNPLATNGLSIDSCVLEGVKEGIDGGDLGALISSITADSVRCDVSNSMLRCAEEGVHLCFGEYTDSLFQYIGYSPLRINDGSRVIGNRFETTDNSSACNFRTENYDKSTDADISGTFVRHSEFKNNYVNMLYSAHGQALSLYESAWEEATVSNNIFHNCIRAVAFKTEGENSSAGLGGPPHNYACPYTTSLGCTMENNLIINDIFSGESSPNFSPTWRNNDGLVDWQFVLKDRQKDDDQKLYFRNNMIYMTPEVWEAFEEANASMGAFNYHRLVEASLEHAVFSDVQIYHNIFGALTACTQADIDAANSSPNDFGLIRNWNDRQGVQCGSNYHYTPSSLSQNSAIVLGNDYEEPDTGYIYSQGINSDTFAVTAAGTGLTVANLGPQWTNIPRQQYLQNISIDWATTAGVSGTLPAVPSLVYQFPTP